ncbi:hypothetical protein KP509_39G008100 [Ceratopteris richardii]|uniref:uracil phosphoribosyltransferase n=1 Tax=Ceratopteris richardii TaxID=49495 RepID=A0A8T2PYD1_CERRI|nr:hypothetical protein KP509_39G008100 [Ceratopteris richardii]
MHCLRFTHDVHQERDEHIPPRWIPKPAPPEKKIGEELTLVYIPPHPLVKHWLSVLRNELSPTPIFRSALAELGRFLIYEAARDWLLTVKGEVQTPCGIAGVEFIDPREPVRVIPILRGGLVLVEHVASVLPAIQTYHIGFVQEEATFQPALYVNKLPDKFPDGVRVLVADPILATGGTVIATIDLLKQRNVDHRLIRVVAAAAAPPALDQLSKKFPGLRIYTAAIDDEVTENGDVVPGIGDAGDRSFGI